MRAKGIGSSLKSCVTMLRSFYFNQIKLYWKKCFCVLISTHYCFSICSRPVTNVLLTVCEYLNWKDQLRLVHPYNKKKDYSLTGWHWWFCLGLRYLPEKFFIDLLGSSFSVDCETDCKPMLQFKSFNEMTPTSIVSFWDRNIFFLKTWVKEVMTFGWTDPLISTVLTCSTKFSHSNARCFRYNTV